MRNFVVVLATLCLSAVAFAGEAAPAAPECDVCKAMMAMTKVGKMEVIKLDNGTMANVTADAKGQAKLDAAVKELADQMKKALEGSAKLDENCTKMVDNIKAGKVLVGDGKIKNGHVHVQLSSDAEIVKAMHEAADKMAAPPAKGAKK